MKRLAIYLAVLSVPVLLLYFVTNHPEPRIADPIPVRTPEARNQTTPSSPRTSRFVPRPRFPRLATHESPAESQPLFTPDPVSPRQRHREFLETMMDETRVDRAMQAFDDLCVNIRNGAHEKFGVITDQVIANHIRDYPAFKREFQALARLDRENAQTLFLETTAVAEKSDMVAAFTGSALDRFFEWCELEPAPPKNFERVAVWLWRKHRRQSAVNGGPPKEL